MHQEVGDGVGRGVGGRRLGFLLKSCKAQVPTVLVLWNCWVDNALMTSPLSNLSLICSLKESFNCGDRRKLTHSLRFLLKYKPNELSLILEGLGIHLWMKELKFHQPEPFSPASPSWTFKEWTRRNGQSSSGSKACFGKESQTFRCFC